MAQVVMFPQKKKLPKGIEEDLHKIAKQYVEVLYATAVLFDLEQDKPTYEELMGLIATAFAEGISNAIDELDELDED